MAITEVNELEGIIETLEAQVMGLKRAESRAGGRVGSELLDVIRMWRLTLESIIAHAKTVIEFARAGRTLPAMQEACALENRIRNIIYNITSYRPVSTGYERILLALQGSASSICKG